MGIEAITNLISTSYKSALAAAMPYQAPSGAASEPPPRSIIAHWSNIK